MPRSRTGPRSSRSASPPGKRSAARAATGGADLGPRLAALLASAYDSDAAADTLLDEIERVVPGSAWLAARGGEAGTVRWLPGGRRPPAGDARAQDPVNAISAALQTGREGTLAISSRPEDPPLHFIPIGAGGTAMACLVLQPAAPGPATATALSALREAAPVIALGLRAHALQLELEGRIEEVTREVTMLYDVSRSLGQVDSLGGLSELISSSLLRTVGFDLCALALESQGRLQLEIRPAGPVARSALEAFEGLALEEFARPAGRLPQASISVRDPLDEGEELTERELRSVVHAPLVVRGQAVGLISLASRADGHYGERRMRLLSTIANQAALTVDRLRRAKEAEASRIHTMLESMAEGVLLLDRDLRVVMSNPAAQAQLSLIEPGQGAGPVPALGGVSLKAMMDSFLEGVSSSTTFEAPSRGAGRLYSITCSPVHDPIGLAEGLVVVISDITESRIRQIQLAQNEKLSALGEMISGVAHELNNPLASVMMHAQLLGGREADPATRERLQTIDAEASRCRRIVQNLLRFARTQSPERRPLDLNATLDSVCQLLGHQLKVDDIELATEFDPGLPAVVGDGHLLQQVFVNITFNAYQAMKERGGPGRLRVRSERAGDRVVVEIADSGPGIPEANLQRIFEPFFSTKEVGKGTGLGLSLAYGTVQEHGGTIQAANAPGGGAVFTIEFPAASADVVAARPAGEPPAPEPLESRETAAPSGAMPAESGRRILVVEDEAPLAAVIAEVLATLGHTVDVAGDGRTAKERIAGTRYDVIITDMKMPNMNGRDLYRHVVAAQPSLARRIIFSTGDTASPETQAFFEEVGNPFLSKPFNIRDLIRVVDGVIGAGQPGAGS